jgi:hypothetical protein
MPPIYTTQLQTTRRAFAEAVKESFAAAGLSLDQMQGKLSAILGDLWNELEADLPHLSRRTSKPQRRLEPAPESEVTDSRESLAVVAAAPAPVAQPPAAEPPPIIEPATAVPPISADLLAQLQALLPDSRPPVPDHASAEAALIAALTANTPPPPPSTRPEDS